MYVDVCEFGIKYQVSGPKMNPNNTIMIKNSFFIENILSKPTNKNIKNTANQWDNDTTGDSKSHGSPIPFKRNENIFTKTEPNDMISEHFGANGDNDNNECKQNESINFASPDSSICEEESVDNLSDTCTNPEENNCNCKWCTFIKHI